MERERVEKRKILLIIACLLIALLVIFGLVNKVNSSKLLLDDQGEETPLENKFSLDQEEEDIFDFSNLEAGTKREGRFLIKNGYEDGYGVFIKAENTDSIDIEKEGALLDNVKVSIGSGGKPIYEGTIKDYISNNIELGRVEAGESREFEVIVELIEGEDFPLEENPIEIKWIITAQVDQLGGDDSLGPEIEKKGRTLYIILPILIILIIGALIKRQAVNN